MLLNLGYFMRSSIKKKTQNTPWQPTDLSSLIGWWDASDASTIQETTTSGRVAQWDDKSGNNNHMYVSTSTNEPETGVTTINGLNTIRFGDSGAMYLSPDGTTSGDLAAIDSQDFSAIFVFRASTTDSSGAAISLKSTNGSDSIIPNFSTTDNYYGPEDTGGGSSYMIVSSAFTQGTSYILGLDMSGSDIILYRDGTQLDTEGAGQSSDTFNRFIFGRRTGSGQLWRGELAEIIVSNALSTADRQAAEGYLANKWGI